MSKLFGVFGQTPARDISKSKPKRFTRFVDTGAGTPSTPDADKKFTRFAPQESAEASPSHLTPRPAVQAALRRETPVAPNLTDHLNSEAQIPLSILRRALPQRFEEMRAQGRSAIPT
ncbi:hypothetical protein ACERZ8_08380 [Tateyamaria armeniaca]|uniref:Uncharacterized protein n=1 Tax=Tateyamaria armeniaca TaxID=2518930 RepID=A0ABW8UXJ3_9RHOB